MRHSWPSLPEGRCWAWPFLRPGEPQPREAGGTRQTGARVGVAALIAFLVLLFALPVAGRFTDSAPLAMTDSFYRSGSLVFGGGHVVLPLLEAEVVPPGWVTEDEFIAGYGAAQAVPGPLFTFSSYLGAATGLLSPRWLGGVLALGAIFLPSFLLVVGVLPFWERLRSVTLIRQGLMGVTRRWWGCSSPRFTTRFGQARSPSLRISLWRRAHSPSWRSGRPRRGWSSC